MTKGVRIAEGRTAEIFAWGDGHVLKLYRPGFSDDMAEFEAKLVRAVCESGLDTPAAIEVISDDGRKGILFERVEGPPMLLELLASPGKSPLYSRLMAELQATIHGRTASGLPRLKDRLRAKIRHAPPLQEAWKTVVLERLEQLPDGDAICHGDFHPDNILMTAGGPVIIDWIDAASGHPLADVSRTLILAGQDGGVPKVYAGEVEKFNALRRRFVEDYLANYKVLRPFETAELNAWTLPVAAARLAEGIAEQEEYLLNIVGTELGILR